MHAPKHRDYRVRRTLLRHGIMYQRYWWNSLAFQELRRCLGPVPTVIARFDPHNPVRAYVFDPHRNEWIEGFLEESN